MEPRDGNPSGLVHAWDLLDYKRADWVNLWLQHSSGTTWQQQQQPRLTRWDGFPAAQILGPLSSVSMATQLLCPGCGRWGGVGGGGSCTQVKMMWAGSVDVDRARGENRPRSCQRVSLRFYLGGFVGPGPARCSSADRLCLHSVRLIPYRSVTERLRFVVCQESQKESCLERWLMVSVSV